MKMNKSGKVIVIPGPSGVGKSTIVRDVLKCCDADFSVSATTRKARPGEADGRDYIFVDRAGFEAMIARGELLEWAEVFGELYGTPAGPVEEAVEAGRTVLLDVDVQGGLQVRERVPGATMILVVPPDDEALAERLAERGSEGAQALRQRLAQARAEIDAANGSGAYDHCVINDKLERAVEEVAAIINQECSKK